MSISSARRNLSAKALDPLFIVVLVAMILAVGSSLMLRVVAGPRPANASEIEPARAPSRPPAAPHKP